MYSKVQTRHIEAANSASPKCQSSGGTSGARRDMFLGPGTYSSSQLHGVGYVEAEDGVVGDRRVEEVDERDGIEHGHLELAPAERVWPFSCSVA